MMKPIPPVKIGKSFPVGNGKYKQHWQCGYCDSDFCIGSDIKSPKSCGCRVKRDHLILKNGFDREFASTAGVKQVGVEFRRGMANRSASCVAECLNCGSYFITDPSHIRVGKAKSCPCFKSVTSKKNVLAAHDAQRTHGMSNSGPYWQYWSMVSRCHNPNAPNYGSYGGKGIEVCHLWRHGDGSRSGFEVFNDHMGTRPDGKSLDRIDNDKGYEPGNCRWATHRAQSVNRRCTKLHSYKGYSFTAAEWHRLKVGGNPSVMNRRVKNWSIEDAIEVPIGVKRSQVKPAQRLAERARVLRNILKTHCGVLS